MIAILEGPDCAGKTMLLKTQFQSWDHVHMGPPGTTGSFPAFDQYAHHLRMLAESESGFPDTAFDRFLYGERIYGPALRGDRRFQLVHQRMMERVLLSMRAVVVACQPSWETCHGLWLDRVAQDLELVTDEEVFRKIYAGYRELWGELVLPHVPYSLDDPAQDMEDRVRAAVDTMTYENEGPGYGNFRPGNVLLVGEQVNPNVAVHDFPFVASSGVSLWLTQYLIDNGISERDLYWVNALTLHGRPTNPTFVERLQPTQIIAMGNAAALWCRQARLDHLQIYHPQYWKRFRSGEEYALAPLIANARVSC
jgi:hypothetical protein